MKQQVQQSLRSWVPYKLLFDGDSLLFNWLYTAREAFTDPFFDSTIGTCLQYPQNSRPYRRVSDAWALIEWSRHTEHIEPTAFIFHVSRCGSTLVSQALGMNAAHISLSEVPVFDAILRLRFKDIQYDEAATNELLRAAIKFYASKRTGHEQKLFIKTDSWHLMFYNQLRKLYPQTPFIILYRNPAEVLHSNQHKKGMQACYGIIEPGLFGLQNIPERQTYPDAYMALVLKRYFEEIIKIARAEPQTLLLNYNQGLAKQMELIAQATGISLEDEYKKAILERSLYNAKYPDEKFSERPRDTEIDTTELNNLNELYAITEQLRARAKVKTDTNISPASYAHNSGYQKQQL